MRISFEKFSCELEQRNGVTVEGGMKSKDNVFLTISKTKNALMLMRKSQ